MAVVVVVGVVREERRGEGCQHRPWPTTLQGKCTPLPSLVFSRVFACCVPRRRGHSGPRRASAGCHFCVSCEALIHFYGAGGQEASPPSHAAPADPHTIDINHGPPSWFWRHMPMQDISVEVTGG
ncbi:hypothetical protein E2C01_039446 [Portunus trituberculatus]|uniref:Uncharacterized protein n=1 Tax=Portunus trituberculatus TaxID=210409 RepID=A0A5B7FDN6_PORTR|nr:hypothetical protein [Portunus trituberculatus]